MKIISAPSKEFSLKGTCNTCKTVAAIEVNDVVKVGSDQREGSWAEWNCPTCGSRVCTDIPREEIWRFAGKS